MGLSEKWNDGMVTRVSGKLAQDNYTLRGRALYLLNNSCGDRRPEVMRI